MLNLFKFSMKCIKKTSERQNVVKKKSTINLKFANWEQFQY